MSHEIVGVDTVALAERAWHGLGRVVGRAMDYAGALELAGLARAQRGVGSRGPRSCLHQALALVGRLSRPAGTARQ